MKTIGFAVLFWAGMVAVCGEVISFDDRFLPQEDQMGIRNWMFDEGKHLQPLGKALPVMDSGEPGVRLISTGKAVSLYHQWRISAQPGEVMTMRVRVRGKGRFYVGFYQYAPGTWQWRGANAGSGQAVDHEVTEVVYEVPVKGTEKVELCLNLGVDKEADVSFYGLRVERQLPRK